MILSRRDGPEAQKTRKKGKENEKEKGIEIQENENENENENLPTRVEAILGSFSIIAKTTPFVSPFWPARRPHNNRRLK